MFDFIWTIILAIVLGVSANLLTPFISKILGIYLSTYREKNEKKRKIFENSVQYILDNPLDEINLRLGTMFCFIITFILWTFAIIILISLPPETNIFVVNIVKFASIIFFLLGFPLFSLGLKYTRIVSAAWRQRKKKFPEIDID